MNVVTRAALLAFLSCATLAAGVAQAGDIKGKVSETGLKSAENIVVYIDTIPGKKFPAPVQHATIDQRDMKFVPHTVVILRGTTVDFGNSDHVAHNVFWPSVGSDKSLKHSLVVVSPNQKKSFEFDFLGAAQLLCNFHPEMLGYVVVVPTPYFALTGYDGTFTIANIPPGSYTLKSWSEDGKPTTQPITVTDAATNVEVSIHK